MSGLARLHAVATTVHGIIMRRNSATSYPLYTRLGVPLLCERNKGKCIFAFFVESEAG